MKLDLGAIEARAEKATPGPWEHIDAGVRCTNFSICNYQPIPRERTVQHDNAEFIAEARSDIPALLAFARDAKEEIRKLILWAECISMRFEDRSSINFRDIESAREVLQRWFGEVI